MSELKISLTREIIDQLADALSRYTVTANGSPSKTGLLDLLKKCEHLLDKLRNETKDLDLKMFFIWLDEAVKGSYEGKSLVERERNMRMVFYYLGSYRNKLK